MEKTSLKSLSILLVMLLAFVYFAQPIYAKANSSDMVFIETSDSTADVKALFTGAELFIPVAITIIGFIAMCYCTLRNVDVPLNYSSSDNFFDKCRSLGQFCIDNCTDDLKNVLYSVYTYCHDNNLSSITGIATFVVKNAAQFFVAFSKWFSSSFIYNRNQLSTDFLNNFSTSFLQDLLSLSSISFSNFNQYSSISSSSCLGIVSHNNYWNYNSVVPISFNTSFQASDYVIVCFNNGYYAYTLNNGVLNKSLDSVFLIGSEFRSDNPSSVTWSSSRTIDILNSTFSPFGGFVFSKSGLSYTFNDFFPFLSLFGFFNVVYVNQTIGSIYSVPDSILWESVEPYSTAVTNPASDQIYYPALDWSLDLWGTWDDVANGLDNLTDKMRAFVGDISLTLDSALANTNVIQGGGEYVFPSFDGIWKYPQYFFDTLKSWAVFVGGCLNAVTVGEGGLSWIFYGGFVILVCGGIIGKILLG